MKLSLITHRDASHVSCADCRQSHSRGLAERRQSVEVSVTGRQAGRDKEEICARQKEREKGSQVIEHAEEAAKRKATEAAGGGDVPREKRV